MHFKPRKTFENDLSRLSKLDITIIDEIRSAIDLLLENDALPEEYADHALSRKWAGYREFHVGDAIKGETPTDMNDVLVIYRWDLDDLVPVGVRAGSHNRLFDGSNSKYM